ncbi:hypothetical protein A7K95_09485 [Pediococcus parvulus]|uniref:Uncharacterized protein n=1 Tax=Pediococcus parvulus TaxID=54062 RepID=A0ABX2UE30_9LACO|nr:hypothetical protein A7K95_09485 [Pediococcus parvulus]
MSPFFLIIRVIEKKVKKKKRDMSLWRKREKETCLFGEKEKKRKREVTTSINLLFLGIWACFFFRKGDMSLWRKREKEKRRHLSK